MRTTAKVLACVDRSSYALHVADAAAWAAKAMNADLELLHILDRPPEDEASHDHSGSIGFNAQEILLTTLVEKDEARVRAMRDAGRVFLGDLRERAQAVGLAQVDIRQRHGELQETVIEQQRGIDLLVLGRRGASAEVTHRDLGRNVEGLIRLLTRPILTVTDQFRVPQSALIAFDGQSASRKSIELLSRLPLLKGLTIRVVMAGRELRQATKQLDWAQGKLATAGFQVSVSAIAGDPEVVIAQVIKDEFIDLLVMGAYSHSPIRALFFGSKTNELLRSSRVPTLLVR